MTLFTNLARLIVMADKLEGDFFDPELSDLIAAFNQSEMGKFMPLRSYAFDGDRAKAVERWLREAMIA